MSISKNFSYKIFLNSLEGIPKYIKLVNFFESFSFSIKVFLLILCKFCMGEIPSFPLFILFKYKSHSFFLYFCKNFSCLITFNSFNANFFLYELEISSLLSKFFIILKNSKEENDSLNGNLTHFLYNFSYKKSKSLLILFFISLGSTLISGKL